MVEEELRSLVRRVYCWLRCRVDVRRFCRAKRCGEKRLLLEWLRCLDLCLAGRL